MKIITYLLLLITIASCTSTTQITVKHAASIPIPADLDSIIIVDRSQIIKGNGNQVGNVLEGIFTGEPIGGDKYGRKGCLEALVMNVSQNERLSLATYNVVEVPNINSESRNKVPLEASFLDSICKQYHADGVIALEYFDSDRPVNYNGSSVRSGEAYVQTQWRLYYPNEQKIVDEFGFQTYGQGYSAFVIDVPAQYKSISRAGAQASDLYIKRIVPSMYLESRTYYTKGSVELRMAAKHIRANNWEQAKFLMESAADSYVAPKLLGRVTYNLAVICEMQGNLEEAMKWANKSASTANKQAPRLISILRTRMNEQGLIDLQMKRE